MQNKQHRSRTPINSPTESTLCRSLVMMLAYVAQDRFDIAAAVKSLTRDTKAPRSGHKIELKRLGRYLTK